MTGRQLHHSRKPQHGLIFCEPGTPSPARSSRLESGLSGASGGLKLFQASHWVPASSRQLVLSQSSLHLSPACLRVTLSFYCLL